MRLDCAYLSSVKPQENDAFIFGIIENQVHLNDTHDFLGEGVARKIDHYLSKRGNSLKKGEVISIEMGKTILQRAYLVILSENAIMEEVRQAIGKVLDAVNTQKHEHAHFIVDSFILPKSKIEDLTEAIAEIIELVSYRFDKFKPADKTKSKLKSCTLLFNAKTHQSKVKSSAKLGQTISECANFTRELVNTPANELPPKVLAERARNMAKECGIKFRSLGKKELQKMKMGGILAVSLGSVEEPRLIVLEYGNPKSPVDFAFVGKGVTFDSGGISIKPSDGMEKMKYDMAGGAAVIGILRAAAKLKLKKHIVGIVPAAENMPSGSSYRPGDVIWMGSGKSVEILNTDAEGRLLLGDGLFYAQRFKPKAVIDLATLTGACVVALGNLAVAVLGNDSKLIEQIKSAGETSGERVWELPLWDDYFDSIKSDIAEIKNTGSRGAGTITAAMFLKQFVNYPWAHLDIAGTAWAEEKKPYFPKGATGVGVRLLIRMLMRS